MRRGTAARCAGLVTVCLIAFVPAVRGQALADAVAGPVIDGFGAVYPVANPDFRTDTQRAYRVVFDVSSSPPDADTLNARIETVARFLNMHARAGVPRDNMTVAVVLHGSAGKDALSHEAYRARFGTDNPNLELLDALRDAGVSILLCGQTAVHRGFRRDELAPSVRLALSAMTALVTLQADGYALISF